MSKATTAKPLPGIAEVFGMRIRQPYPLRLEAYDGSSIGDPATPVKMRIESPKALRYMITAPGELGLARAYISGELSVSGFHPGDPYPIFGVLIRAQLRTPAAEDVKQGLRSLGIGAFVPPSPPEIEALPHWRRHLESVREPAGRRAAAISKHYDVGNAFYEKVLGPSMTYTCAAYTSPYDTLEEAQENKNRLVFDKLNIGAGDTLLDVGCGWGGMVRYAARRGVKALGVTLSRSQADWAAEAIEREGLADLAEVRYLDYRDSPSGPYDAISSIGLTEHIGTGNYESYFGDIFERLKPGGRFLNHCITRPMSGTRARPQAFTDRYTFPDGELASPGFILEKAYRRGFELAHSENLRIHYAYTLREWCRNLVDNWDFCVEEAGLPTAKVWGLYMAGSRYNFEQNNLQLHQLLLTRPGHSGDPAYPLRPDWEA